ncbi:U6 snRNA-associated Sm LSm2 [Tubulinosema ratisbonensis]|uniref:U6 snRNA-associated Sm LSm2 n=1 Tax=Tubulinosema ratisbonensis TaxID=291195 RepID=A0A437API3_9MICR|nr:U6 snRNA-associated Sm LSm2 [Tubulinosema ratisbonensis]
MLFYSFFKDNLDSKIEVILKNNTKITGILKSVDQYLNFILSEVITDIPYIPNLELCSIRGSSVRTVKIDNFDSDKLNDATRFRFV